MNLQEFTGRTRTKLVPGLVLFHNPNIWGSIPRWSTALLEVCLLQEAFLDYFRPQATSVHFILPKLFTLHSPLCCLSLFCTEMLLGFCSTQELGAPVNPGLCPALR